MFGCERTFSVIYAENAALSTASAPPAGTRVFAAASIVSEPKMRISSFRSPQALPKTSSLFKEFGADKLREPVRRVRGRTLLRLAFEKAHAHAALRQPIGRLAARQPRADDDDFLFHFSSRAGLWHCSLFNVSTLL